MGSSESLERAGSLKSWIRQKVEARRKAEDRGSGMATGERLPLPATRFLSFENRPAPRPRARRGRGAAGPGIALGRTAPPCPGREPPCFREKAQRREGAT